ncbi:GIY-YIG nuclease family protein [Gloeothece verrucosa]|uniref:GIY-YIG domain-containing protein n=1 Tax=Gloeothece verrucosa (strain PCC 7822) TaxID=497965 RepID=E0UMD5_GLOV7|nr:GIY-YIG nuclease family protein [Gloeothece verrucosa]ADN18115.1 hypothetical protein Cyan7822_6320 [Gloeothece verrucosa PCC 7822]
MSQNKVYLLHYEQPIGNKNNPLESAQHYLGSTDNLASRLLEHRKGNGAKITAAFFQKKSRLI